MERTARSERDYAARCVWRSASRHHSGWNGRAFRAPRGRAAEGRAAARAALRRRGPSYPLLPPLTPLTEAPRRHCSVTHAPPPWSRDARGPPRSVQRAAVAVVVAGVGGVAWQNRAGAFGSPPRRCSSRHHGGGRGALDILRRTPRSDRPTSPAAAASGRAGRDPPDTKRRTVRLPPYPPVKTHIPEGAPTATTARSDDDDGDRAMRTPNKPGGRT